MAAAKSILIGLCGLLGLGALALGVMSALSLSKAGPLPPGTVGTVSLRPFPKPGAVVAPSTDVDAGAPTGAAPTDAGVAPAPPEVPDAGAAPPPPPPPPAKPADAGAPQRPAAPPPPPQPVGEGTLNLRASDTADVFVDGKKVGGSPIEGLKVKAGTHKIRFDCYDASGNSQPGAPKTVSVQANGEQSVDYTCPAAE